MCGENVCDENAPPFVPCTPKNSIAQHELEKYIGLGVPLLIKIMELEVGGFYVVVKFEALVPPRTVYLVTRTKCKSPRIFKDLTRFNRYLRENCPTNTVELHRNQQLPPTMADYDKIKK